MKNPEYARYIRLVAMHVFYKIIVRIFFFNCSRRMCINSNKNYLNNESRKNSHYFDTYCSSELYKLNKTIFYAQQNNHSIFQLYGPDTPTFQLLFINSAHASGLYCLFFRYLQSVNSVPKVITFLVWSRHILHTYTHYTHTFYLQSVNFYNKIISQNFSTKTHPNLLPILSHIEFMVIGQIKR